MCLVIIIVRNYLLLIWNSNLTAFPAVFSSSKPLLKKVLVFCQLTDAVGVGRGSLKDYTRQLFFFLVDSWWMASHCIKLVDCHNPFLSVAYHLPLWPLVTHNILLHILPNLEMTRETSYHLSEKYKCMVQSMLGLIAGRKPKSWLTQHSQHTTLLTVRIKPAKQYQGRQRTHGTKSTQSIWTKVHRA